MEATETTAVAFGIVYILLAVREHRACWIAGGISTALYTVIFFGAGLPMQAVLQVLYVALSIYGWLTWGRNSGKAPPSPLPLRANLLALAGVALATVASAPLVARYALAASPVADSLGTWASLVATWLLARRYVDNWYWWIVIDSGLAMLFASQGLWLTATLYLAYSLLAIAGWRTWRRSRMRAL